MKVLKVLGVMGLQLLAFYLVLVGEYDLVHSDKHMTPLKEYFIGVIVTLQLACMLWLIADLWRVFWDALVERPT